MIKDSGLLQISRIRNGFLRKLIFFSAFFVALPLDLRAENISFLVSDTSRLSVHAVENDAAKANIIAIVGGKGVSNSEGRSRNYLVKQKKTFFS